MTVRIPTADRGEIQPTDDTFLLFVDETGEDSLSDPKFPIFGFGGVGLPAALYASNICNPWIHIKERAFGGETTRMHAADLRKPTSEQLELLNKFFNTCAFTRIAAVISDKTAFRGDFDLYHIAVIAFYQRIRDVLQNGCRPILRVFFTADLRGQALVVRLDSCLTLIGRGIQVQSVRASSRAMDLMAWSCSSQRLLTT